jgi:bifunctional ADP-heptose synthase (sugar kinase/adenylyltransferase)
LFLDTRTKIIPASELRERLGNRPASQVSGSFDPLLAEHVRRLEKAREPGKLLVVEITNPAQPLLGQRARAELVAALSTVDWVVLGDGTAAPDADLSAHFIQHVLDRHQSELRQLDLKQQEARG